MNIATAALRRLSVLALAATLAVVVASVASAAIPSANGTINACYDKQTGQARIVDPATNLPKNCTQKEAPVSWNVQGPAGPAGAAGQDGVSGWVEVTSNSALSSSDDKTHSVFCPAGTTVLGGGAAVVGPAIGDQAVQIIDGVGLVESNPFNEYGWSARAEEFVATADSWYLKVWAVCANAN
jgi:hypothetical protein